MYLHIIMITENVCEQVVSIDIISDDGYTVTCLKYAHQCQYVWMVDVSVYE